MMMLQAVKFRLFFVMLILFSPIAFAHSLHLFAQYDGQAISGIAYYSDQTPASETYIEAKAIGQKEAVVSGKTDKTGHFHLPIVSDQNFSVVIEGMEGHRAEMVAQRISPQTDNQTLLLLREDINQLKQKIYLHDILGGIGYLCGIFGLWALWQSAKGKR